MGMSTYLCESPTSFHLIRQGLYYKDYEFVHRFPSQYHIRLISIGLSVVLLKKEQLMIAFLYSRSAYGKAGMMRYGLTSLFIEDDG